MFTGIITEIGRIESMKNHGRRGAELTLAAPETTDGLSVGQSVAVNGCCLTVTSLRGKTFTADVSPETLNKSNLDSLKRGSIVNLERAMGLQDRLEGHLVQGHVDGTGKIKKIRKLSQFTELHINIPSPLAEQLILKGSIALDGVSLTINDLKGNVLFVTVIPHTASQTIIKNYKTASVVNIETDMIGKYVRRYLDSMGRSFR